MSASIAEIVDRANRRTIALTTAAVVGIGLVAALVAAVRQDDGEATDIAKNLSQELAEGAPDGAAASFAREVAELGLDTRRVEGWDGTTALGSVAGAYPGDGCRPSGATIACGATNGTYHVAVRTPLARHVSLAAPVALAVFVTAVASALLVAAAGRRTSRRALAPLLALERSLHAPPAKGELGSRAVAEDWGVAEVDALAAALRAALARAELASAREARFVADAAHELRTPLTRLQGQLELVADDPTLDADARRRITSACRNARELVALTESLLAMARGELPAREAVDLSDVVAAATQSFDEGERARISAVVPPDALVEGTPALLERALRNLVENALRYTAGPVAISVVDRARALAVEVADEGEGLADADLARVKVAFVRGPRAPREPGANGATGTGIGLALAEHVAELHGGTLELSNREGGGLLARMELPRWSAGGRR